MSEPITPVPSWLETPPSSEVLPPVDTKVQNLPFAGLSWEDFQKLCLRLVRFEANVEHCQIYGAQGQKQEGIDLFARQKLSEKYRVYQCKRVEDFRPADIKKAVEEFLKGNWVDRTELRGGSGNSDSVVSGSLASPTPGRGGRRKERGDEEDETESRSHV